MNRRRRPKKRAKSSEDMVLQITSMADIFTILLVFLLKSFATGVTSITPTSNLNLPVGTSADPVTENLKVEISENAVTMDDRPITQLTKFRLDPTDIESDGTPRSLNAALIKERGKDTLQKNPRLLILADQAMPYSTLKAVLASASNSGFADFKLLVVEDQ
ncbi:MAG: ExbD/TolR family protein [Bdellovibrionota bacterium]